MFLRANFSGDPNIGLYGFATDSYILLGRPTKMCSKIEEVLNVKASYSTVLYTDFPAIFCAGNSQGIVVSMILREYEIDKLKEIFSNILVLDTDYSALGNLILLNDSGIVISPLLRKHKKEIQEFFNLPCEVSKIAGTTVVGSMAVATNKGCIVGSGIKNNEIKILEDTLNIELGIGTVSFGSRFVHSGIIANSSGCVVSDTSSGPELGRVSEALGFS